MKTTLDDFLTEKLKNKITVDINGNVIPNLSVMTDDSEGNTLYTIEMDAYNSDWITIWKHIVNRSEEIGSFPHDNNAIAKAKRFIAKDWKTNGQTIVT